jgi:hypothetical protein
MKPWNQSNYILVCALVFSGAATLAEAQNKNMTNLGSWSGVIINSNCSVDEAFAEAAKCTANDVPGAKLVFYDDTLRLVLKLDPQDQAAGHLGDSVTVEGMLDGDTIRVASIKLLAGIGLAVGQKAPAFSAPDQFGAPQTLETLRGPNGTVLLFFRSADW